LPLVTEQWHLVWSKPTRCPIHTGHTRQKGYHVAFFLLNNSNELFL